MADKVWNFKGTLQENGIRVVSAATATAESIDASEEAFAQVVSNDGIAQFQFKIPKGEQGPQGPAATLNLSIDGNTLLFS